MTWLEQNHHLKSVQHLSVRSAESGENEVFTLDTRIVPSAAWQSIKHLVQTCSKNFKETFEIEFRVSESLLVALQLFQKAFHVRGIHLMHRR